MKVGDLVNFTLPENRRTVALLVGVRTIGSLKREPKQRIWSIVEGGEIYEVRESWLKREQMKVGDLVTLSSYGKKSSGLSAWNDRLYPTKPQLVGLVVRREENPNIRSWTSKKRKHILLCQLDQQGWSGESVGKCGILSQ